MKPNKQKISNGVKQTFIQKSTSFIILPIFILAVFSQIAFILALNANFLLAQTTDGTSSMTPTTNTSSTSTTDTSNTSPTTNVTEPTIEITVKLEDTNTVLFGTKKFFAISNHGIDKLVFYFDNPHTSTIPDYRFEGASANLLDWSVAIDTYNLANGPYNFSARGFKGGNQYESKNYISITIDNKVSDTTSVTPPSSETSQETSSTTPTSSPTTSTTSPSDTTTSSTTTTPTTETTSTPSSTSSTPAPTSSTPTSPTEIVTTLTIKFVKVPVSPLTADQAIYAETNQEVDFVKFRLKSIGYEIPSIEFPGIKVSPTLYHFFWRVSQFPSSAYIIRAIAAKNSHFAENEIEVKTSVSSGSAVGGENQNILPVPPSNVPPVTSQEPIRMPSSQYPISPVPSVSSEVFPECIQKGFIKPEECQKYLSMPLVCRQQGFSFDECQKYLVVAIPWQCREKNILEPEQCKKYMFEYVMPPECRKQGVTTHEECSKIIFLEGLPPQCRSKLVTSKEECDKILASEIGLAPQCKSANISNPQECEKYMLQNFMPKECQEAKVSTKEECDYILRTKYKNLEDAARIEIKPITPSVFLGDRGEFPLECRQAGVVTAEECEKIMFEKNFPKECLEADVTNKEDCEKIMFKKFAPKECQDANITTPQDCEKHMIWLSLPGECRDAGVTNKEDCEKIMFKKNAPKECLDAQIFEPQKCEKFMFEKFAPSDCREAGILTAESCKKYMFEKYGKENIPVDKFPLECQKAGAETPDECEKVMKKMYLPGECQKQGITEPDKCDLYFQQKYMPGECRDAGAKSRSECDKIMFKKFGPLECRQAEIEDEAECRNYMFNKYAPKVECKGLDDWQCKNFIKERHLGNITAKQTQFDQIKEKTADIVGESVKASQLEAKIATVSQIVPFKEKEIGIKVVAALQKLILDDEDNLIQDPPIALMLDSDQDGLPDDIEERLSTDPYKTDTDDDGYNDGEELKNGYNPLGPGEFRGNLAAIDQVIIANQILGQPKSEGEVSQNFAIQNIINKENYQNGTNTGYTFSGKAEPNSVATLYIYSDLPLVVTVATDQFGNWQYELNKSLVDGQHEVYIALNDNTGKVLAKSNSLDFFVKEAKAISVKDFVSASAPVSTKKSESLISNYIIIAVLTIIIGLTLFIVFLIQKKKEFLKS